MAIPKKQKYRKAQKGRIARISKRGTTLAFGSYGLKVLEPARLTPNEIEAARKAAVRAMNRKGKFFIRVINDLPVSKKPVEVRMGKGKGPVEYFAARVSPGRILFEVEGVPQNVATTALELAASKLSVKVKEITRV